MEHRISIQDADEAIEKVCQTYAASALVKDTTDGFSFEFEAWRFNLRKSNTEPLVRLNVETRGDTVLLAQKTEEILSILDSMA